MDLGLFNYMFVLQAIFYVEPVQHIQKIEANNINCINFLNNSYGATLRNLETSKK